MHPMHVHTQVHPHVYGTCMVCIQVRETSELHGAISIQAIRVEMENWESPSGAHREAIAGIKEMIMTRLQREAVHASARYSTEVPLVPSAADRSGRYSQARAELHCEDFAAQPALEWHRERDLKHTTLCAIIEQIHSLDENEGCIAQVAQMKIVTKGRPSQHRANRRKQQPAMLYIPESYDALRAWSGAPSFGEQMVKAFKEARPETFIVRHRPQTKDSRIVAVVLLCPGCFDDKALVQEMEALSSMTIPMRTSRGLLIICTCTCTCILSCA